MKVDKSIGVTDP